MARRVASTRLRSPFGFDRTISASLDRAQIFASQCPRRLKRHVIIAPEHKVVKARGIGSAARGSRFVGAHDVGCGAHLYAAEPKGPLDERDLQLDCCPDIDLTPREETDAARTDVASNQPDGRCLFDSTDFRKEQRQAQRCARKLPPLLRHADCMGGDARKPPRS